jgi:hypothetical protein
LDSLPKDSETFAVREFIMRAYNTALSEAKKIFTVSQNTSDRLKKINNIYSTLLCYPEFNRINELGITWDNVVKAFTQ